MQKQPPEVCSIGQAVFKNSQYSQANAFAGVSTTGVFLWILQNFKSTYFEKHLWTAASQNVQKKKPYKSFNKNSIIANKYLRWSNFEM